MVHDVFVDQMMGDPYRRVRGLRNSVVMGTQRRVCVRDVVSCRLTSSAKQRLKRVRKEISVGGMSGIVEVTGLSEDSIMGSNWALEIPRSHLRGTTLAWCVATQPRKSSVQLQLNSTIFNMCTVPTMLVTVRNDILMFVLFLFLNILQQRYQVGK